jgi:hypothetical protein
MTDEQFEKRMEFIVEQQAQFAVGIQKLEEAQARLEKNQIETDAKIRALATVSLSLTEHIETLAHHLADIDRRLASFISETNARFQATDEKIQKLVESQAVTDIKIQKLVESQAVTDIKIQRLVQSQDALIDIVRRQTERSSSGE